MGKHALLSASSSERWINCPPSARLNEAMEDKTTTYSQEGTDAHNLCAYEVEKALGYDVKDPTTYLEYYCNEMQNCADDYRDYVLEQLEVAKQYCNDPLIFIEQRLDYSK